MAACVTSNLASKPVSGNVSTPPTTTGIDNFLTLIRKELVTPLHKITELAARIESLRQAGHVPTTLIGEQLFTELEQTSRQSAAMVTRLLNLTEVLGDTPILCDDRLLLVNSLHTVGAKLADMATRRRVGIRFDDNAQTLAPIYGSRHWLELALFELIRRMVAATPSGLHVLIRLRQVGFHQLVTAVTNHSQPTSNSQNLLTRNPGTVIGDLTAAKLVGDIDIATAQAIVELHHGKLKVDVDKDGALLQFTLTMPTGEQQLHHQGANCTDCAYAHQAEQFAQDIGELLQMLNGEKLSHSTRNPS